MIEYLWDDESQRSVPMARSGVRRRDGRMISTMDKIKMIERQLDYDTRHLRKAAAEGRVSEDFAEYTIRVWKAIRQDYVRELQQGDMGEEKEEATDAGMGDLR